ncbi:uncharacterized protein LOC116187187 [Punica granatum]|uniref:Uncharacterized protein n=2 Tax=Punica granatum TaxID=22663 RepID=A0A218W7L9_PUNGR|nr:uncharacterized protein LOC116187187 [Punica granatum]XP_031371688.1 uncharacterized protein LOC116187187 [Punica granatum]OWM68636.1 hypothetical protein CDL15_Pgr023601 [Punica granatum]PKI44966.1 hypothetical protein CRG98_034661 [Punica granatum]
MAAAEARAVWQRTVNRCFVQEDAKRAPKLACCQSSSSGSKQVDAGPAAPEDGGDHPVSGFMSFNRKPSFCNLPSDTRWWLQLQPSYVFLKGLPGEQFNASEAEVEGLKSGSESWRSNSDEVTFVKQDDLMDADGSKTVEALLELSNEHLSSSMSKGTDERQLDASTLSSDGIKGMKTSDIMSSYEFVELDNFGSSVSKQHNDLGFDAYSPWIGNGKSEPWWRMSDREELASLVARKSLDHVENCDLPPPQKVHVTRHPYSRIRCLEPQSELQPSINRSSQPQPIVSSTQKMACPDFGQNFGMKWGSADEGHFTYGSDKSSSKTGYSTAEEDMKAVAGEGGEPDPSKAQLLEALCHSQTRAREAENAVKRANAEKEHIIKLFFKQASQLFAYKQWFQLLQLESIHLQIKNGDDEPSVSAFFPEVRPRTAYKGKKLRRNWQKVAKGKSGKRGETRVDVTKYAVAIALGFGLVGAGLLLGWTVGWMLPRF